MKNTMHRRTWTLAFTAAGLLSIPACGDDEGGGAGGGDGGGATSPASTAAATTGSDATTAASSSTTGSSAPTGGTTSGSSTTGDTTTGSTTTGGGPTCTQAREDAIGPVASVSEGAVTVLEVDGAVTTLFVDASAGGIQAQAQNPWVYLDLGTAARADVDDLAADTSQAWDVAIKRPLLRVNGGDGGLVGAGESAYLEADFDAVTPADVGGATFETESWFDADCNLRTDPTGAVQTSFDGWYQYIDMQVLPAPGTWLVRSGSGDRVFKLEILDYYANPDGSTGQAGGRYVLRVAEVTP